MLYNITSHTLSDLIIRMLSYHNTFNIFMTKDYSLFKFEYEQ